MPLMLNNIRITVYMCPIKGYTKEFGPRCPKHPIYFLKKWWRHRRSIWGPLGPQFTPKLISLRQNKTYHILESPLAYIIQQMHNKKTQTETKTGHLSIILTRHPSLESFIRHTFSSKNVAKTTGWPQRASCVGVGSFVVLWRWRVWPSLLGGRAQRRAFPVESLERALLHQVVLRTCKAVCSRTHEERQTACLTFGKLCSRTHKNKLCLMHFVLL